MYAYFLVFSAKFGEHHEDCCNDFQHKFLNREKKQLLHFILFQIMAFFIIFCLGADHCIFWWPCKDIWASGSGRFRQMAASGLTLRISICVLYIILSSLWYTNAFIQLLLIISNGRKNHNRLILAYTWITLLSWFLCTILQEIYHMN
jgi:hypothetical protein